MRRDLERLQDTIAAIERYTREGRQTFDADELVQVWCLRHIEVLGEAASRLSDALRQRHPSVPWREIVAMRNLLIHGYFDVDWEEVWNVVERDLPNLKGQLQKILEAETAVS